jgi:3-deoxy-7-phosphoheptulonate synthase
MLQMGSLAGRFANLIARPSPPAGNLIDAYNRSAATLNLLRSFANGGYAAMQRITQWNLDFTSHSDQGYRYIHNHSARINYSIFAGR